MSSAASFLRPFLSMKGRKKKTFDALMAELASFVAEAPPQCTTPEEAYCLFLKHFEKEMASKKECMVALYLDGRRRVIAHELVSMGTLTATLVHPREVFRQAIVNSASSVLMAHNHPSGDPTPSHEDRLLTERMKQTGQLVGINLDDHLVIGKGCFVSMRQLGILAG